MSKLFGLSETERAISKSDFHIPIEPEDEEVEERSLAIEVRVEFPELKGPDGASLRAIPECFNQMIIEDVGSDPYCRIRLEAKWTATNVSEGDIEQAIYWIEGRSLFVNAMGKLMTAPVSALDGIVGE